MHASNHSSIKVAVRCRLLTSEKLWLDCNYLPSDIASDTEQGLLDSATVGFFINSLVSAGLSMPGHFIKPSL